MSSVTRLYVAGRSPHPKRPECLSTFLITQTGTTVDASTKFSCKAMVSDFICYRTKKNKDHVTTDFERWDDRSADRLRSIPFPL